VHFYITGDTHRSFDRIEDFCYGYETTTEDGLRQNSRTKR
jgi:hypothetical protein